MYIEEVIIDGFKSYSCKTQIGPFHRHFNAITGLNGTGKSNILDAICFVMGISNLEQVRAKRLQNLVYKQGQAGITKASVTLVFNNNDQPSPIQDPNYKFLKTISITRQCVIGGRNKFFINACNARPSQVLDLLQSVQLNINNPHFLIMQGRITKVINMKPREILGLVEEASGTRLYENKKVDALRTLQRKQQKLSEVKSVLSDEIEPRIVKLRKERDDYYLWASNAEKIETYERYGAAFEYFTCSQAKEQGEQQLENLHRKKEQLEAQHQTTKLEVVWAEKRREELLEERRQRSEPLESCRKNMDSADRELNKTASIMKEKHASLEDAKKHLNSKEGALQTLNDEYDSLMEASKSERCAEEAAEKSLEEKRNALQNAENKLSTLLTGCVDVSQQSTSLRGNLNAAETALTQTESALQANRVESEKLNEDIDRHQKKTTSSSDAWAKMCADLGIARTNADKVQAQIDGLSYREEDLQSINKEHSKLTSMADKYAVKLQGLESRLSTYLIEFEIPHSINPTQVFGQLFSLLRIKEDMSSCAVALEVLGGSRLSYIVVDRKETSKQLMTHNRFAKGNRKVTVLPLQETKVSHIISREKLGAARQAVGCAQDDCSKVLHALDTIEFQPKVLKAMQYVYGQTVLCSTSAIARQITFGSAVRLSTCSFNGDLFNTSGSMHGGATRNTQSVLSVYSERDKISKLVRNIQTQLGELTQRKTKLTEERHRFNSLTMDFRLAVKEVTVKEELLAASKAGSDFQLITDMKSRLADLELQATELKDELKNFIDTVKRYRMELESLTTNKADKEKELKQGIKQLRKELASAEHTNKRRHKEAQKNQVHLASLRQQIVDAKQEVEKFKKEVEHLVESCRTHESQVQKLKAEVVKHKEAYKLQENLVSAASSELQTTMETIAKLTAQLQPYSLQVKKNQSQIDNHKRDVNAAEERSCNLIEQYPWLSHEIPNIEKPNPSYDFRPGKYESVQRHLEALKAVQSTLNNRVSSGSVSLCEEADRNYLDLKSKAEKVEDDRIKIEQFIADLDVKKQKSMRLTWQRVNKHLGSIFTSVLPGAQAQLVSTGDSKDFLSQGLELKVAFNNRWRESLSELSGGQRSLLALSLILSLLKCKPCPVYILDEIDAALDLSHTQNIGLMIKTQFPNSQFLVVSLKEGMFNNADVLFRTQFVDNTSCVERVFHPARSKHSW